MTDRHLDSMEQWEPGAGRSSNSRSRRRNPGWSGSGIRQLHDPTAHAEQLVLRQAGQKLSNYRLNTLELYVTLSPLRRFIGVGEALGTHNVAVTIPITYRIQEPSFQSPLLLTDPKATEVQRIGSRLIRISTVIM